MKLIPLNLLTIMTLCLAMPVQAENEALMELLKALHENGTIDKQVYELVKGVAQSESESEKQIVGQTIQQITQEEVGKTADKLAKEKVEQVRRDLLKQALPESKNSIRVGGRIQIDATTYTEDKIDHSDGTEIRRARLYAKGSLGQSWGYKLQYEFTDSGIDGIQDAYLDYKGFARTKIRIGHFKEPFSLQNMTSSRYILFTERGLPDVFVEGRNLGLQASQRGENWTAAVGLYGEGPEAAGSDDDEGFGASGRFTYAPLYEKTHALHLGTSASFRSTGSTDTLRFRERPESHLTSNRLVDTGNFDADIYARFVAEAAYVRGPFHLQGEYYQTIVNREISANEDLAFNGFYVEGGWFLTGESMNYKASKGGFSRVTPKNIVGEGGSGAWQVAFRYSSVDLTDEDIRGGEEDNFTFGVNWFATANIRFAANYVNVLDVRGGANDGDEPESFQLRTQVEF